jgi:hypothetical protein
MIDVDALETTMSVSTTFASLHACSVKEKRKRMSTTPSIRPDVLIILAVVVVAIILACIVVFGVV